MILSFDGFKYCTPKENSQTDLFMSHMLIDNLKDYHMLRTRDIPPVMVATKEMMKGENYHKNLTKIAEMMANLEHNGVWLKCGNREPKLFTVTFFAIIGDNLELAKICNYSCVRSLLVSCS